MQKKNLLCTSFAGLTCRQQDQEQFVLERPFVCHNVGLFLHPVIQLYYTINSYLLPKFNIVICGLSMQILR